MPNREDHIRTGLMIGGPTIFFLLFFSENILSAILQGLLGLMFLILGSILPDIIEPPTDRFHRATFHSYYTLGITGVIGLISLVLIFVLGSNIITIIIIALSLGYFIHLVLDSQTKMGLPE
ncbi:MAG: hypothetical protein ACTSP3_05850 [Candidatus Heimdallarchaeaceae archaeon]